MEHAFPDNSEDLGVVWNGIKKNCGCATGCLYAIDFSLRFKVNTVLFRTVSVGPLNLQLQYMPRPEL